MTQEASSTEKVLRNVQEKQIAGTFSSAYLSVRRQVREHMPEVRGNLIGQVASLVRFVRFSKMIPLTKLLPGFNLVELERGEISLFYFCEEYDYIRFVQILNL